MKIPAGSRASVCLPSAAAFRKCMVDPGLNVCGFSVQAAVNVPVCIQRFSYVFVWQTRAQWNGRLDKSVGGAGRRLFIACLTENPRGSGDYHDMQLWDQQKQTCGGSWAHFHTLIHLCAFSKSFCIAIIKWWITVRKYFSDRCENGKWCLRQRVNTEPFFIDRFHKNTNIKTYKTGNAVSAQ